MESDPQSQCNVSRSPRIISPEIEKNTQNSYIISKINQIVKIELKEKNKVEGLILHDFKQ